ncbi:MAG: SDR family oxidoreductase [candidate division Zixibacteria bacterium]|nr:SDR family oxidoreductase [candidate division Zixibacteria bacterium]
MFIFRILIMKMLNGKNAVVVGASRGIGASVAKMFAGEGARVFLVSRDSERLEQCRQDIENDGGTAAALECDITEADNIENTFRIIGAEYKHIDVLVNSAAFLQKALIEDMPDELMIKTWETNVLGIFRCCRAALDYMKPKGGSIINISSLSGVVGVQKFESLGAYNISKYGLWGLTEILGLEWSKYDIRVNAVSPGGVDTEMFRGTFPGVEPSMKPADIARVCLFLASDESASISGQNFIVSKP